MYGEDKYNVEHARFLLDTLTGELNRSRDWPIRILGVTSALHFAVIAGILVSGIQFAGYIRCVLAAFFTGLFVWTFCYFRKCHINYLTARNAQIRLENQIGVGDMGVLRIITTAHITTTFANTQVDPCIANFQAIFAAIGARFNFPDLIKMFAQICHYTLRQRDIEINFKHFYVDQ